MENGIFFDALSSSEDTITLLHVSQSLSSSSTSTEQSKSIENASENLHNLSRNITEKIGEISGGKWRSRLRDIEWKKYIRWNLLFTFGFILWGALCIVDLLCPKRIYMMREQKKLGIEGTRDFEATWTLKCFSYISNFLIPNLLETLMFFIIFGIFAFSENSVKKKWFNYPEKLTNNSTPLLSIYHERDFLFDGLDESEDTYNDLEYPEGINYIKIGEGRKLRIHPEFYWHWKLFRGIAEITTEMKKKSKRLNKLGLHTSTSGAKNLLKYDYPEQSNSNTYETYDQEIYRFIEAKKNSSTTAFDEIVQGLQKTKRKYPTWTSNPHKINSRIISSSPAFKDFLSRLNKNPTPFFKPF